MHPTDRTRSRHGAPRAHPASGLRSAGTFPGALARQDGYSLLEIMVVIVLVGVLALIALPRFTGVIRRAKMTEAKTMLRQVHALQQAYYYERDAYALDLSALGFEQARLVTAGGTARYRLSVEAADADGFHALATSVVDFDRDGTLNVWQVDEQGRLTERTPD